MSTNSGGMHLRGNTREKPNLFLARRLKTNGVPFYPNSVALPVEFKRKSAVDLCPNGSTFRKPATPEEPKSGYIVKNGVFRWRISDIESYLDREQSGLKIWSPTGANSKMKYRTVAYNSSQAYSSGHLTDCAAKRYLSRGKNPTLLLNRCRSCVVHAACDRFPESGFGLPVQGEIGWWFFVGVNGVESAAALFTKRKRKLCTVIRYTSDYDRSDLPRLYRRLRGQFQ
ncbi:hypothetical protein GOBAR_AA36293 [Gossypium barbadense]|uniref:Uncharacterized protein n=1 Tax=Gossypium barbadense TaxID=3634 RepID=A0A2P5W005_GOSBA|nr:hypothetical protein GOBAR_AA36293 [Gossypium barbadense]